MVEAVMAKDGKKPVGVAILGSTGSVGRQVLTVIDAHPGRFRVVALAARAPSPRFASQIERYAPLVASVAENAQGLSREKTQLCAGADGLLQAAIHPDIDIVVVATSGHVAILPTIRALELGKTVALANKEVLVCAGELIAPLAADLGRQIRPVDSEHSAVWQALGRTTIEQVQRIIITASGGPFRTLPASAFGGVTAEEALAHPTWSMGGKITIDSATLMNKGLEVIEAHWLFGLPYDRIDVVVHPESVVHSLVEFVDGSLLAQLGAPDMRLPIQFALTFPDHVAPAAQRLDLAALGSLHFDRPDEVRFPALRLAREAGIAGQTFPTVLSTADDEAVSAFLAGAIRFTDIPAIVETVLAAHEPAQVTLDSIRVADEWARTAAMEAIAKAKKR